MSVQALSWSVKILLVNFFKNMAKEKLDMGMNMKSKIMDASNQFVFFKGLEDEEHLKEMLASVQKGEGGFKTLEKWTGETTEKLERFRPGICGKYNVLVERMKSPSLTAEEAKKIAEEAMEIIYNK